MLRQLLRRRTKRMNVQYLGQRVALEKQRHSINGLLWLLHTWPQTEAIKEDCQIHLHKRAKDTIKKTET